MISIKQLFLQQSPSGCVIWARGWSNISSTWQGFLIAVSSGNWGRPAFLGKPPLAAIILLFGDFLGDLTLPRWLSLTIYIRLFYFLYHQPALENVGLKLSANTCSCLFTAIPVVSNVFYSAFTQVAMLYSAIAAYFRFLHLRLSNIGRDDTVFSVSTRLFLTTNPAFDMQQYRKASNFFG
jgi:hypothetical protein